MKTEVVASEVLFAGEKGAPAGPLEADRELLPFRS